jgi:hypothetical protein
MRNFGIRTSIDRINGTIGSIKPFHKLHYFDLWTGLV